MKNNVQTFKSVREKGGLTRVKASKILGITVTHLYLIECGKRNPSDKLKKKMMKLYGIPISDFYAMCQVTN